MSERTELFLRQLDAIRAAFAEAQNRSRHDDLSDLPRDLLQSLIVSARAAVERISGPGSVYSKRIDELLLASSYSGDQAAKILGVVKALDGDVRAGFVSSARELAHAELFADFLEMADHLLTSGYKDAAAVIAGSALEAHLRQLAEKLHVPTTRATPEGPRPIKAEQLNHDLVAQSAYSKLDQKSVTAWLGLRNDAAHGHFDAYSKEQVAILIAGVRDFMQRVPA